MQTEYIPKHENSYAKFSRYVVYIFSRLKNRKDRSFVITIGSTCISNRHMLSFYHLTLECKHFQHTCPRTRCRCSIDHTHLSSTVRSSDILDEAYGDFPRTTAQKWRAQAMASNLTCLVTLHGIGFAQPPQKNIVNSGYADQLHLNLRECECLKERLTDDPEARPEGSGVNGAIYVESLWQKDHDSPPSREEGLKRLGSWDKNHESIITNEAPLFPKNPEDGSIAHIALVYSNLEPRGPIGAALIAIEESFLSATRYGSVFGLMHMVWADLLATRPGARKQKQTSARPRSDLGPRTFKQPGQQEKTMSDLPPGLITTLRSLVDDVACYVCHNEERERVRSFVVEALTRLASRIDVDKIILNTHSNGTVITFDVLRGLPEDITDKIKGFVTAGSPLRKYVDLFQWGHKIQSIYLFDNWHNFWDELDPVADPLRLPIDWRVGDPIPTVPPEEALFGRIDLDNKDERPLWIKVEDHPVDNREHNQSGGLQAHNYWDNKKGFVVPLANIICQIADMPLSDREG